MGPLDFWDFKYLHDLYFLFGLHLKSGYRLYFFIWDNNLSAKSLITKTIENPFINLFPIEARDLDSTLSLLFCDTALLVSEVVPEERALPVGLRLFRSYCAKGFPFLRRVRVAMVEQDVPQITGLLLECVAVFRILKIFEVQVQVLN